MAFWPFRRKRKELRTEKVTLEEDLDLGISTHISGPIGNKSNRNRSRQESRAGTRSQSKSRTWPHPVPPLPLTEQGESLASPQTQQPKPFFARGQSSTEARQPLSELQQAAYAPPQPPFSSEQHLASQTSLQAENFTATPLPTLRPKKSRTATDVSRVKSSKRKAEEKERLEKIRASSTPIPIPKRPRSFTFNSPLAQDHKHVRNGLNGHFERPTSQVSLPVAESLRSSMSATPDMSSSFRVSAFASLSPRPTIRHSSSTNLFSEIPSRASTRKDKNPVIPEEPFSPRARIDELAEDMDASTLRKLMERDGRRKEQKKKSDTAKLERKLRRRLEKEKELQEREYSSRQEQGNVAARAIESQEAEASSAAAIDIPQEESSQQAAKRPAPQRSPSSWLQDQSSDSEQDVSADQSLYSEGKETPIVEMAQTAIRLGPSNEDTPVLATAQRAVRMTSPAFERSQRAPLPPLVIERSYKPKHASGVPQRTKSKFKEDLPDFRDSPVSPLSPYIDNPAKVGTMTDEEVVVTPLEDVHPLFRDEIVARAP